MAVSISTILGTLIGVVGIIIAWKQLRQAHAVSNDKDDQEAVATLAPKLSSWWWRWIWPRQQPPAQPSPAVQPVTSAPPCSRRYSSDGSNGATAADADADSADTDTVADADTEAPSRRRP
jgi:hypothetical protein